ncbi:MAG TPA: hypothetical protein VJB89_00885 [Candidatus Nanoarchaeia archaeon]|nr:hypothetical protein [Candidatus Nanoarchaeia archaeon]
MKNFIECINLAQKHFKTADHLTYVTYSLINEPKLLLTVVQNLQKATYYTMEAIISFEQYNKNILTIPSDFESRFQILKKDCAKKYEIDSKLLNIIWELNNLTSFRQNSSMEFVRQNKYVLCDKDYSKIEMIDIGKIKNYLINIRILLKKLERVKKNV